MKILQCKINTKKTNVKPIISNLPTSLIKEFKKFGLGDSHTSYFDDYNKVKKFVFKFGLDEKNKTIGSLDSYPANWHGIFKKEKLEFKKKYSSEEEKIYGCTTTNFYGIGGMYATVLYRYVITVSSNQGLIISPSVYIAHPHKSDKEPKFKLCDNYDIYMDCIGVSDEELNLSTGIDKKDLKNIMSKSNMKKAISILKAKPKKSKKMFSRRAMQYQDLIKYDRNDLIKLAKFLNEITYDLLNDELSFSTRIWFKEVFVQFYILHSIHHEILPQQSLLEVLDILKISKDDKNFEGMTFPVQK